MSATREALRAFAELPLSERLFVRARLFSAPLEALAARVPPGAVADVGCGHGLLTALLAAGGPDRTVLGIDPDPRKIAYAERGPGKLPNVRLEVARIEELSPRLDGTLDGVVVADVLYLLPVAAWEGFLATARRLLKPGGRLLLKEAEANRSWKYWKCLAQEQVMVKLLGKTQASGGLGFQPRAYTSQLLARTGFHVEEVVDLSPGYATPHVLFVARVG